MSESQIHKLRVVSGCPRSGTSCMMDQHRIAFGEDNILGFKWPQERQRSMMKERQEDEDDVHYENRMYLQDRLNPKQDENEEEHYKLMNPNGFWEGRYTVRGIAYHPGIEKALDKPKVVKIVSQGLFQSDPQYIDKILYMVRCPRQVAKSQENLRRMPWAPVEWEKDLKVHTPKMFITVTYQAAKWFLQNPSVPVMFVNFDDMISDPDGTMQSIQDFWGAGDFGKHTVEKRLKRSAPEDVDNYLWPAADLIYALLKKRDWQGIVDFYEAKQKWIHREDVVTPCLRLGDRRAFNQCLFCRSCPHTRKNLIAQAEKKEIDWKKEPCVFETMTDPDREDHVSIQESIDNNFWEKNEYFKR